MNNKTYLKTRRKKSFASFILAFLMMFTFNSSPMIMLADNARKASAYKSAETKTFYASSKNESESKFSDPSYPSSYKDMFSTSSKNFNLLSYYNTNFEKNTFKLADEFFRTFDEAYAVKYKEFLKKFGVENLEEFFTEEKNNFLKSQYKITTVRELIEQMALEGFPKYLSENKDDETITYSLPAASSSSLIKKYQKLSDFYRLFANKMIDGTLDSVLADSEGVNPENLLIETPEAFYKKATYDDKINNRKVGNSHYNRIVDKIDSMIMETAPTYAFDNTTQDTNVAAIFANMVPTTVPYNYVSNSFVTYSEPSANYVTKSSEDLTKVVYYFGSDKLETLDSKLTGYVEYVEDKSAIDMFYYRRITADDKFGYIEGKETYYKYKTVPYLTTSSKKDVYVLTDSSTTQDDLDTIKSIHFNTLSPETLENEKDYYIQVPYESDELFFKAIYNDLYSSAGFNGTTSDERFKTFVSYFTTQVGDEKVSKLYVKLGVNNKKIVYIDKEQYEKFSEEYKNYAYKVVTINTSDKDAEDYWNPSDYEKVVNNNSNSGYYKIGYDLYFEKTKEYYTETGTTTYDSTYETKYNPSIPLLQHDVAGNDYVLEGNERKIYVVGDTDNSTVEINSVSYTTVTKATIEKNLNFYVEVPSYIYTNKGINSETYSLYFMHKEVKTNKLFIVDDADSAKDNKVYKTLNFEVISSTELKENITNYVAVKDGDANYNKNFQLYYKYDRTEISGTTYLLNQKGIQSLTGSPLKLVEKNQLSDYVLIDKDASEENQKLYDDYRNTITFESGYADMEIKLYRKLSDIFVQNNLKGGTAIYVMDTSVDKNEKETYSKLMYTSVTESEIKNNPDLYVLIDSNDASNYFADYKLYYKYKTESTPTRVVYSYEDINKTAADFDKNDYELITSGADYVEGKELYYKKNVEKRETVTVSRDTYYYYQTSSTTSLASNSYYVISFYVNTIGENARATFGIKDTSKMLDDINVSNIATNGKWEKYYVFLSTNATTASTINLYLYMGDEKGIKGNTSADTITGSVFFDDIKIIKIGLTDFNKFAIDDIAIYSESTLYKDPTAEPEETPEPASESEELKYADEHNNRAYIVNTDDRFKSNKFDAKNYLDSTIDVYGENSWANIFDFDDQTLQSYLGKETGVESEKISSKLNETPLDSMLDGYDMYTNDFTTPWKYYISRDLANDFSITNHINAYNSGKLDVSITNKIEESEKDEDKDEDEDKKDDKDEAEKSDIVYVSSPFKNNNFALKLENTSKDTALGITSNSFKVKQFEYYKISLWIYSPDLEGKATISVNSILTDRQHPVHGSLLSSSVSATYANVANSTSKNPEYGWIPVSLYIEGNNFQDMDCYLVLTAEKDCTVYFDNIRIEKATSAQYDTATSSSSDKYTCALSLTPKSSLVSSDLTNGTFDYVKESSLTHDVTSKEPYTADNWTSLSTNSSRVVAGIVSTQQDAFFNEYSKNANGDVKNPKEYDEDITNVFAIYSPATVEAFNESTINYKHTYSIYSASLSLSSNSLYKISFNVYKNDNFTGKIISNIYASSVKIANIISTIEVDSSNLPSNSWQTITYYIATSTSSQTVYLEIGVEDATNTCFFKNASAKKITDKTIDSIIQSEVNKLGFELNDQSETTLYDVFKTIRFLNLANADLSYHSTELNESTNMYDSKAFTDKSELTTSKTVGKTGVTVASYFTDQVTTTYSVTIDKTTYYIGEVYEATIDEVKYYIHRTYDSAHNEYEYKLYSDSELKNEITKINDLDAEILTTGSVKLKVDGTSHGTTTTYRLFKFADLREEVTTISGSSVSVPDLENVVVGKGSHETKNAISSKQNTSYVYNFTSKDEYEINNNIIPAQELQNNQSANVMILANGHSTDSVTVSQSATRTLGKSSFNVLRIYVKTSEFAKLKISVDAVNVVWNEVNTFNSEYKDKYNFVCYEILVQSNSSDSISSFGVTFTLENKDDKETSYAIISEVSIEALSSQEMFDHYSSLVGDDKDHIKKAVYANKTAASTETEKETDDENSLSWATFFYIFSSILLVVTMAVAMIAIFLKKHPIKASEKFENDHDRDIQTISSKTPKASRTAKSSKSKKAEIIIDLADDNNSSKNNEGGII